MSDDVAYDSNGRVCFEGSMNYQFTSQKLNVSDDQHLQLLRRNNINFCLLSLFTGRFVDQHLYDLAS
jgi:hypothetical protein